MLVKSRMEGDHVEHMGQMFKIWRKYQIKLNLLKCAFEVTLGIASWSTTKDRGQL